MAKDKKVVTEHNVKGLRELSIDDLKKKLIESSKDQFKLRMQKGAGQLAKPHLIKMIRRLIAKIKTVLTEKNK
jgi:large subunit ribosomal protein L29